MSSGHLIAAYIFGSVGRGENDERSDIDILAVVKNGAGKVDDSLVASAIPSRFKDMKMSISWYGGDRLREMFRNGELFAWHLHKETIPLIDPEGFLSGLGTPNEYRDAYQDVVSFQNVLRGIPKQLAENDNNAVYEAGLIYVCLRNIAMAASSELCVTPDFSRYSPFKLSLPRRCPISVGEYETIMNCRMAGQRGLNPPNGMSDAKVIDLFNRLEPWVQEIRTRLIDGKS